MLSGTWRTFMPLWQPKGTFKKVQHDHWDHILLGAPHRAHSKVMFHTNPPSISLLYGIRRAELCPCTRLHLHYAHHAASARNKLTSISRNQGIETLFLQVAGIIPNSLPVLNGKKNLKVTSKRWKHRVDTSILSSNENIFSFQALDAKYSLEPSHYG